MENQIDWCKYFADIEADPTAKPPRITVRQWMQREDHLAGCDTCYMRVERILAKIPRPQFPERGMN